MKKVYIFIDEFGNAHLNLEKEGTFSHFVYTAFLITEDEIIKARKLRDKISKEYFQGSFIKSSKIKTDEKGFQKRVSIINEIKKLNYAIHSFVVDKSKIDSVGLSYKKSFYKYFHRLLIEKFPKKYSSFEIYFDKIGRQDFQQSLESYIDKYIQRSLFEQDRKYRIADDKVEEPLIQFADFFSGCIGKVFCVSHIDKRADKLFDLVNDRLFVNFFPHEANFIHGTLNQKDKLTDNKIANIAKKLAVKHIENENNNEEKEVLQYLNLISKVTPDRIVSTNEIVNVVKRIYPNFTDTKLRTVIQNLRDKGIIIVSPQGEKGYKLPTSANDIISFYNRYLGSIVPMLKRINISNKVLFENSNLEIEILKQVKEFDKLQKLINVIESK